MRRTLFISVGIVLVLVLGLVFFVLSFAQNERDTTQDFLKNEAVSEREQVRTFVKDFGEKMKTVRVDSKQATSSIRSSYKEFVSEKILKSWIDEPRSAPARIAGTSPERIMVSSIAAAKQDAFTVTGKIILENTRTKGSSTENVSTRAVKMTVARQSDMVGEEIDVSKTTKLKNIWQITNFQASSIPDKNPTPAYDDFTGYTNDRFNYSVAYPAELFSEIDRSQNGDGAVFTNTKNDAELRVFASYNVQDKTLDELIRQARQNDYTRGFDYARSGNSVELPGIAPSGQRLNQKIILKNNTIYRLKLYHSSDHALPYPEVVEPILSSFKSQAG